MVSNSCTTHEDISPAEARMFVTAILLLAIILLLLYLDCRKPKGYPPGPKWWPVLGCILEVARIRRETKYLPTTCATLCKKYGSVVGLRFGRDRIVVLNDLESARTMLIDENCEGRPNGPLYEVRTFGVRQGLIVADGRLWVEQRRFVMRHLRDLGFGRTNMATTIEYEAQKLVEHFKGLLRNNHGYEIIRKPAVNNNNNAGQIYQLRKDSRKKPKLHEELNGNKTIRTPSTAADLYMRAEDYEEVRRVSQSAGMIVSMHDIFGVTVLNTLWRLMASTRFDSGDKKLTHLQRIFTKLLEEVDMIGALFSHFPWLRFVAPEMSGYKAFLETHQQLWAFVQDELKNHKNTFVPDEPRDLMDLYLTVLRSKDHGDTFSESQLLAICVDLFIAGSETTTKSLGFGFLYLMLFPEVQRKAQEEIDRILDRDQFPTLADRPKMPYVQAIVLESVRFFVGRCMSVPHRALKDTFINGHKIPKDTMLVVNFNGILMNEIWGDPENFRPERFLDDEGNIIMPENYFPFGIGRHRCMGEILAKSNLFIIIATLLQSFTFSVVPGEPRPSMTEFVDGVTPGPIPYKALVSLRT